MFSATWPESVEKLAHQFLTDPVQVTVGELELSANKRITQIVEVVDPREKNGILLKLLSKYHKSRKNRVLIFVLYKKEADRVERFTPLLIIIIIIIIFFCLSFLFFLVLLSQFFFYYYYYH